MSEAIAQSIPETQPTAEQAPQIQQPSLAQQILQVENSRNICSNLMRLLKEASFPGAVAWQVDQSIGFVHALYQSFDQSLKAMKEQLARENNGATTPSDSEPTPIKKARRKKA